MESQQGDVTRLLNELRKRNESAAPRLFAVLYDDLRRLAQRHLSDERDDHTLQATALVHEVYIRLVGSESKWQNRAHFFAVASGAIRHILVDHARAKRAAKRPSSRQQVSIDHAVVISERDLDDVISVDLALARLSALDMRQARIVEMRYFGGLTVEEIAEVLGISLATVHRDWVIAKAWLHGELKQQASLNDTDGMGRG